MHMSESANIPPQAIPSAPPHLKNYSEGAMYATPARVDIATPVAKTASITSGPPAITQRGITVTPTMPKKPR